MLIMIHFYKGKAVTNYTSMQEKSLHDKNQSPLLVHIDRTALFFFSFCKIVTNNPANKILF